MVGHAHDEHDLLALHTHGAIGHHGDLAHLHVHAVVAILRLHEAVLLASHEVLPELQMRDAGTKSAATCVGHSPTTWKNAACLLEMERVLSRLSQ